MNEFQLTNMDGEFYADSREIAEVIERKHCDLLHLCRKFHTMGELNKPVQNLIDYGWLREVEPSYRGFGRKPSPALDVNPLLFGNRT